MDDWPFDQPQNCAVITLRQIVLESAPILHVTHDSDDDGWQFLGLEDADEAKASVVSLANMLRLDPSLREIADLPPGWHAWRGTINAPWSREPIPREGSA